VIILNQMVDVFTVVDAAIIHDEYTHQQNSPFN